MVQPTPEIDAFIERICALPVGPGVSLDAALQPSLDEEAELRTLFATDRQNTRLSNPYVGLVNVFAAPDAIRVTRARVVQGKEDLSAKYVMPLSEKNRREEGAPCMVADLEEFKKNWAIFTEGSLVQLLDWNNVIAAGGSVLACLTPLDDEHKKSKRAIRKYYHTNVYPTSDVDLFLWGLNAEQAEAKIKQIYDAVRDSVPWDVTCIRTKHTVSIHCQYPYRSIQIVLRLYHSPAEVLAGFDIDAPCCFYDGDRVWANPRAIVAMIRQCNTVDVTRRSPSYEVRLAKYSARSYEVYVPTLARDKIDPTIYERSILKIKGLARLLVLEMLKDDQMRESFLRERRQLRDRPATYRPSRRNRRKYKGDLKQDANIGLEMNDYDVGSLHIPYGPGWDARRINKLVYQTDLGMNSTFNPKNKGRRLHRHPAFFGTAEEVAEDCCEHCPKPIDKDEEELQQKEDETYIRGRIQFIEDNPGRQSMTGSFNPIDEGEWGEQVYIRPIAQLFQAIATHDRATVLQLLKDEKAAINVHQRDHVGRTVLHVAILVKDVTIAEDLIDAGARITARLADGRTPLHLATQHDLPTLITKLMERSKKNQLELEGIKDSEDSATSAPDVPVRPSSEDDWSSHDDEDAVVSLSEDDGDDEGGEGDDDGDEDTDSDRGDYRRVTKTNTAENDGDEQEDVLEDKGDEPDIIDVDTYDWDFGFTALCYAVLYGSLPTVEGLLTAGADVKLVTKPPCTSYDSPTPFHPLTMTIARQDDAVACEIVRLLIKAGATSTSADASIRTIFHIMVRSGRTRLVETILRCDPDIAKVINLPYLQWKGVVFPVATAIHNRNYATLVLMIAHGAKLNLQEADITKACEATKDGTGRSTLGHHEIDNYLHFAHQPVELALTQNDDIAQLLISMGANFDIGLKRSLEYMKQSSPAKRTVKDWVEFALQEITARIKKKELEMSAPVCQNAEVVETPKAGWVAYLKAHEESVEKPEDDSTSSPLELEAGQTALEQLKDVKEFLLEIQSALSEHKAKSWQELYPADPLDQPLAVRNESPPPSSSSNEQGYTYVYLSKKRFYYGSDQRIPQHLLAAYDELYEACYVGDNEKIQSLCLPTESTASESPLNISVRTMAKNTNYWTSRSRGYTPLFAAIAGRRWSTAKLILAIATAQYQPDEDEEKIKFDIDVMDDDEFDTESDNSDDSDITIEQEQIKFVDIATRPSEVRSRIHPEKLLTATTPWRRQRPTADGMTSVSESGNASPIEMAIIQHDLDAFIHVSNLYESLPQSLPLPDLFDLILQEDQADIMDEYIKRSGNGIDVDGAQELAKTGPMPVVVNDENKIYLGLNVHGKKRADLAKKNDPNAVHSDDEKQPPLLWRAIRYKASAIVSYLASQGPLAAYHHYASVHSDSKAIWFRRLGVDKRGELEKWLPTWLGWSADAQGESPLSAAILSGDVEMIKLVAKLDPKLFAKSMQTQIKFGLYPLLLAVCAGVDIAVLDYLLTKKASPDERDSIKGWNIYHFVCSDNQGDMLKFFLEKLPRNINESLLAQRSRVRRNTPLHIAVKRGHGALVSILLNYTKDGLLAQDVDGQTPLHCAVARSFHATAKYLLQDQPNEGLVMENGVGNTPVEIATLAECNKRVKELTSVISGQRSYPDTLYPNSIDNTGSGRIPVDLFSKYEAEFNDLKEVVVSMIDRGIISDAEKIKVKHDVQNWLDKMDTTFKALKLRHERREAERKARKEEEEKKSNKKVKSNQYPSDTADVDQTMEAVKRSMEATPANMHRKLIHLLDVQKSVNFTLGKVNPHAVDSEYEGFSVEFLPFVRKKYTRKREDDEDFEADAADTTIRKGMVHDFYQAVVDTL